MQLKNGSPCLFMRQWALKLGYFYWSRVKKSNHFHTKLSLAYLEDAKFYLGSKASFIHVSSFASFKLCLIAWLREYCTFSDMLEIFIDITQDLQLNRIFVNIKSKLMQESNQFLT